MASLGHNEFICQVTNNILRINNVQTEDRGLYVCDAESSAGQARAGAILEVECKFSGFLFVLWCLLWSWRTVWKVAYDQQNNLIDKVY